MSHVKAVVTGQRSSAALLNNGQVKTWGYGNYGTLGLGTKVDHTTPQLVSTISGITHLTSGAWHMMALNADGALYIWGSNSNGQLGDNRIHILETLPILLTPLSPLSEVYGGQSHTLALTNTHQLKAWGRNDMFQLGDNTNIAKHTPENILVEALIDPADRDIDADGYTPNQGDCNDNSSLVYPSAVEICEDGIDQDCDGSDLSCGPSASVPDSTFSDLPTDETPNHEVVAGTGTSEDNGSRIFLLIERIKN